jgi:drug/metabolite transporter (DMT)-like permease
VTARSWVLFSAVSVIWGMPYLFIKIAVDGGLPPGFLAWTRVALGALVLLPFAFRSGALRGLPIRWLIIFAIVEIVIPFPLMAFAEQRISSSLTAIVMATLPLSVAVLALRIDSERLTPVRLAGLLVGLAGVAALVGIDIGGDGSALLGVAMVFVTAVAYAVGSMIVKLRFASHDPAGTVAASLGIAAVLLVPIGLADTPSTTPHLDAIAAVLVLGIVCAALAFQLNFKLIVEAGVTRAAVSAYIQPAIALILGVVVLGESAGPGAIVGMLLIVGGSWLATDGRFPPGMTIRRPGPATRDVSISGRSR